MWLLIETIAKTVALLISVYIGIYLLFPTILTRLLHIGAICRGPSSHCKVALTFDDGPHPEYTPQVLNILKQFQVKACFFVLGERAKAYPDLLLRIKNEGHEIASHGYRHNFSWFRGPYGIIQDIRHTSKIISEITGRQPRFYRPPWGLLNFSALLDSRFQDLQVVLWSFMSWDWNYNSTDAIVRKILLKVNNGSILIFHDNDEIFGATPGAPKRMIDALPVILTELKNCGLEIVALSELTSLRNRKKNSSLFRLWRGFDKFMLRLYRIEDVTENGRPTVFRLTLRRYRGKQLLLADGSILRRGDMVGEIHFNNEVFHQITGSNEPIRLGLLSRQKTVQALTVLAGLITTKSRYQNIKAVIGISLFQRGSRQIGFDIFDLNPLIRFFVHWYEGLVLMIYHPAGRRRFLPYRKKLIPKLLVMSKKELLQRYLPGNNIE